MINPYAAYHIGPPIVHIDDTCKCNHVIQRRPTVCLANGDLINVRFSHQRSDVMSKGIVCELNLNPLLVEQNKKMSDILRNALTLLTDNELHVAELHALIVAT